MITNYKKGFLKANGNLKREVGEINLIYSKLFFKQNVN